MFIWFICLSKVYQFRQYGNFFSYQSQLVAQAIAMESFIIKVYIVRIGPSLRVCKSQHFTKSSFAPEQYKLNTRQIKIIVHRVKILPKTATFESLLNATEDTPPQPMQWMQWKCEYHSI